MEIATRRKFIPYIFLFLVSLLLYAHTAKFEFVLDDKMIVENNPLVMGGSEAYSDIFTTNYSYGMAGYNDGLYRPLNIFLFNVQYALWEFNPMGYHWVNILLYAVLGMLVFHLLLLLFGQQNHYLNFFIALLFVVHPIHSEVVANVKSLDEILALLFGVAAFIFMLLWANKQKLLFYLLSLVLFVLALLSKESILSFCFLIPFALYYLHKQDVKKSLLAFGGLVLISGLWFLWRSHVLNSMPNEAGKGSFELLNNSLFGAESYLQQLVNALWLQVLYLKQIILPYPLVFDYSYNSIPLNPVASWQSIVTLVLIGFLVFLGIKKRTQNKAFVFGLIFYAATIFIVSNILIKIGMTYAERFAFTPSLGILIALGFLFHKEYDGKDMRFKVWYKQNKVLAGMGIAVFLVFSIMTVSVSKDWKSNLSLYEADIEHANSSARANYSYGTALMNDAQARRNKNITQKAILHLEKAIAIYPDYQDAYNNLGICYSDLGEYAKAIETLMALYERHPEYTKAWYGLGIAHFNLKQYKEGIKWLVKYSEAQPNFASCHYFLALSYGNLGNFEEAIKSLKRNLELQPRNIDAWMMLAKASANLQRYEDTRSALESALKIQANNPEAEALWVYTLFNLKEDVKGMEQLRLLEQKYPNDPAIQNMRKNLGFIQH